MSTSQDFPLLLSPFRLRPELELRNRVVFQPHFTALANADGTPSPELVAYHGERARGGVGLIVTEGQAVHATGRMNRHFVDAWDEAVVPGYRRLTDAVHAAGAAIISQVTHGGPTTALRPPELLWSPTQLAHPPDAWSTKAMDEDDIAAVIDGFAAAARNAVAGGFDGMEVKIAHDGLLRAFVSPDLNHRTDRYGGSFANRMRLPLEVLSVVRTALSDELALGVRLCLSEFTSAGYELDYGLRLADAIEAIGVVDYFNADHGSYSSTWYEIPPFAVAEGSFRGLAAALKRQTQLPVISSGCIRRPALAEEVLAAGEGDLVGMARQLIADPWLVRRIAEDRDDEVRPCIACNDACVIQTAQGKPIRCVVNPAAGRELELGERARRRSPRTGGPRVVVVGGGPGGLKAAEAACLAGARVTLLERSDSLGGLLRLAARQPLHGQILDVARQLGRWLERRDVDVRLGVEADGDVVASAGPDAVIVATGSASNLPDEPGAADDGALARRLGRQDVPQLAGLGLAHVRSSDRCFDEDAPRDGAQVLVVDETGHWETLGTAELLAERGCVVEVIAAGPLVGALADTAGRVLWHRRAIERRITVSPNVALLEIVPEGARVRDVLLGRERLIRADVVVPVLQRRSCEDLYLRLVDLLGPAVDVRRVGDCVAPRLLQHAIAEAEWAGRRAALPVAAEQAA